jgi:hypothetical protein
MRSRFAGAKLPLVRRLDDNPQFDSASVYKKAGSAMPGDTPVLDTLSELTAASVDHSSLEAREHMLTCLAALVAVDAPAVSYLANVGTAADVGVTVEDVQGVLIAVARIVGTPPGRVSSEHRRGARLRDRCSRGRD